MEVIEMVVSVRIILNVMRIDKQGLVTTIRGNVYALLR